MKSLPNSKEKRHFKRLKARPLKISRPCCSLSAHCGRAIHALDNGSVYTYRAYAYLAAAHTILGNLAEARRHVDLMLAAKPDVTFKAFVTTTAFVDPSTMDFFGEGLRKAGLDN